MVSRAAKIGRWWRVHVVDRPRVVEIRFVSPEGLRWPVQGVALRTLYEDGSGSYDYFDRLDPAIVAQLARRLGSSPQGAA